MALGAEHLLAEGVHFMNKVLGLRRTVILLCPSPRKREGVYIESVQNAGFESEVDVQCAGGDVQRRALQLVD